MEKETTKHTPEPWELNKTTDGLSITSKNGVIVHCYSVSISDYNHDIPKANAARIVECVNAMTGIEDPKKWVEERKANMYKETLAKIDLDKFNFEGRCKQVESENEKLKKALGRIYTMDTSFENYINAIVELKQIAGDAIK
jgi:hypothetical protein